VRGVCASVTRAKLNSTTQPITSRSGEDIIDGRVYGVN
jgi:hypothetical protein